MPALAEHLDQAGSHEAGAPDHQKRSAGHTDGSANSSRNGYLMLSGEIERNRPPASDHERFVSTTCSSASGLSDSRQVSIPCPRSAVDGTIGTLEPGSARPRFIGWSSTAHRNPGPSPNR